MPARSCKDFISQYQDNITFRAYYPITVYERKPQDNNLWNKGLYYEHYWLLQTSSKKST